VDTQVIVDAELINCIDQKVTKPKSGYIEPLF
jgi:hypothetical protein